MRPARLALLALTVAAGMLAWALWWPGADCEDPACVKQRFSVFIEVDALRTLTASERQVVTQEGAAWLKSLLASGGVDVTLAVDQTDIPYDASAGRLDRADLFQIFEAWRSLKRPAQSDAMMYALMTPGLVADNGERLFGIMFDYAGREAFAIAPAETRARFEQHASGSIPLLQMRTFAHEVLHALNRSHLDAAQIKGGGLTVEAPTKCISNTAASAWWLREEPLSALSPGTIRFLQTAPPSKVLPGKANSPYELRRASATECDEVRSSAPVEPVTTLWGLMHKRLGRIAAIARADAAQDEAQPQSSVAVELQAHALPSVYPLGYPVAIRLIAANRGERPVPLKGRLAPGFGLVRVDTRRIGEQEWHALRPFAWYESTDDNAAWLETGESTQQTIPIYFGEDGWTFPAMGSYEVRVRLVLGDDAQEVTAQPVRVNIGEPVSAEDTAALQLLIDESGDLDFQTGQLIAFAGRIGSADAFAPLERIVADYADTALGSALRLTLANRELRPPLDPTTGTRPQPDSAHARLLLEDTCSDSGVAALRYQMLQRHHGLLGASAQIDASSGESRAWDGVTDRDGGSVATYSDPALIAVGPSLHFCTNESRLRTPVRNEARRLVRRLRAVKPDRVVVVGHTDYEGSCGYNDELALARAQAVKRLLQSAGLPARNIVAASLGERRPVEFGTTPAAWALNRRVEILLPAAVVAGNESIARSAHARALPSCPSASSRL